MPKSKRCTTGKTRCEAMQLVLDRQTDNHTGVQSSTMMNFTNGSSRAATVLWLAAKGRAKERKPVTWIELNYCPWCGGRIRRAKR